jgi:hypothetical protein
MMDFLRLEDARSRLEVVEELGRVERALEAEGSGTR